MAYSKSKDLATRSQSEKVLRDKAFKIASDPNVMVIKEDYLQWFTSFLIKNLVEVVLLQSQIINFQMSFRDKSLENSRNEKLIHPLETMFGALI